LRFKGMTRGANFLIFSSVLLRGEDWKSAR
jgi:hypothetical protein